MDAFAPSMFRFRARLLPMVPGKDPDGGPSETFPVAPGDPLPCRIRQVRVMPGMAGFAETGPAMAQASFPADPGVRIGWRVQMLATAVAGDQVTVALDAQGQPVVARSFRCLGRAQSRSAEGVLWVVDCQAED